MDWSIYLFSLPTSEFSTLTLSLSPAGNCPFKNFIPLTHPQNLHPERDGDGGVFAPSLVLTTLLMTPDCRRRSLMRIKWAPFHPPPSTLPSCNASLPISPIGRSLHHRGCQSGKAPTAGRREFWAQPMFNVQLCYPWEACSWQKKGCKIFYMSSDLVHIFFGFYVYSVYELFVMKSLPVSKH